MPGALLLVTLPPQRPPLVALRHKQPLHPEPLQGDRQPVNRQFGESDEASLSEPRSDTALPASEAGCLAEDGVGR